MVTKRVFKGIITPAGWSSNGGIESISLQTIDENELIIEKNTCERELRALISRPVAVKGRVRDHLDGKRSIAVREYRSVGNYCDDGCERLVTSQ